jgi:hypothetical protein
MKIVKDHPAALECALQAGKLLQNFGLVEMTSYRWIEVLSGSGIAVEISRELVLAKRIEIILKLVDRDTKLAADKKEKARRLWKQIKDKGCERRNTVAHGTVGLAIAGDDTSAEPKVVGLVKIRKWSDTDELMSIDELKGAVNTTARIVEELNELLGDS